MDQEVKMPSYYPITLTILSDKEVDMSDVVTYPFAAYDKIIRPLLSGAKEAFVYKGTAVPHLGAFDHVVPGAMELTQFPFLAKKRGKFVFDLRRDCVSGYENFWNAGCAQRGSIVIHLREDFDLVPLFPSCFDCGSLTTPRMGQSPGAYKMCQTIRSNGGSAVLVSSDSGIRDIAIYAPDAKTEELAEQADRMCGCNGARQFRLQRRAEGGHGL